ncbi:MAG: hypothetical protein M3R45_05625 [Pseudomonadota bacterium]|nr:hypothetical protein [Pseudomonadota bacterium]
MIANFITALGVDCLSRTLASHVACAGTHGGPHNSADRTGYRTDCRASKRTPASASARSQMMVFQVIADFRIDDFSDTAAGLVTGHCANRSASGHADRTGNCTDGSTSQCATARAHAGRQVVILQIVSPFGIGDFARAFTDLAPSHRANGRTGCHANGTANGTDGGTRECATAYAYASGEVMVTQTVGRLRIDDFGRTAPGHATCRSADGRANGHAHRAAHCADTGARNGPAAGADSGADSVFSRCAAFSRIHALCNAFASQAARNGTNGCAHDGSHGAGNDCAQSSASDSASRGTNACAHRMSAGLAGNGVLIARIGITHGCLS